MYLNIILIRYVPQANTVVTYMGYEQKKPNLTMK